MENEEDTLICSSCGNNTFIQYVHFGSYLMKCLKCKSDLYATSFIAVVDLMTGTFKATQIDENISEIRMLAVGKMDEIRM